MKRRPEQRYAGVTGFEVFDRGEARKVLDERVGPRFRLRMGRFELNRPALACLEGLGSAVYGVLLVADGRGRFGMVPAPVECPAGKRQPLLRLSATARTGLSEDWPAAVAGVGDFLALHGVDVRTLGRVVVADVRDGVLGFDVPGRDAPAGRPDLFLGGHAEGNGGAA